MESSLNSVYYFFSYSKFSLENIMKRTVTLLLEIIPQELANEKIFGSSLFSVGNPNGIY
jgi:hypothetical protein